MGFAKESPYQDSRYDEPHPRRSPESCARRRIPVAQVVDPFFPDHERQPDNPVKALRPSVDLRAPINDVVGDGGSSLHSNLTCNGEGARHRHRDDEARKRGDRGWWIYAKVVGWVAVTAPARSALVVELQCLSRGARESLSTSWAHAQRDRRQRDRESRVSQEWFRRRRRANARAPLGIDGERTERWSPRFREWAGCVAR